MDCYNCGEEIGSLDSPIFVLPNNKTVVCRGCYSKATDKYPDPKSAQFDPHLVSVNVSDEYFKSLED